MKNILNKNTTKLKNNKGFTLLEIMMVVALLSLVATLSTTSLMKMELASITEENFSKVEQLYFELSDKIVGNRVEGDLEDVLTPGGGTGRLWRGFNPASAFEGVGDSEANDFGGRTTVGEYDVAFMVDYPDYIYEDPSTRIYYNETYRDPSTSDTCIDVYEGYQIPSLTGLIDPEPGFIQAYGILLELHTGNILEVSLLSVPYEVSSNLSQTRTNAHIAAKYAANVLGDGVRNSYSNYISNHVTGMTTDASISDLFYFVPADEMNGYGVTHMFNRNNMMCNISSDMLHSRYIYSASRATGIISDFERYLDSFDNRTIFSQLAYCGFAD